LTLLGEPGTEGAMKIGYALVSTKDQTVALPVDALEKAGRGHPR
jgi:hypothetical protein